QRMAGLKVLIVDDNETNRDILLRQTAGWRMQGEAAAGGVEAMDKLRMAAGTGRRFDLVLLDMQMPGMNGLELAQLISTEAALGAPKLVLLTSLGERLDQESMSELGISSCLFKPIRQSELFNCLAKV